MIYFLRNKKNLSNSRPLFNKKVDIIDIKTNIVVS